MNNIKLTAEEFIKENSMKNEIFVQTIHPDYWVSNKYRIISDKKTGCKFIRPLVDHQGRQYFVACKSYERHTTYLDDYVGHLVEVTKKKEIEEALSLKQRELHQRAADYVKTMISEDHPDYGWMVGFAIESLKSCKGKSTCSAITQD